MAENVEVKNVFLTRTVLSNLAAGSLDIVNLWAVMDGMIDAATFAKVFLALRILNVILTVGVRIVTDKPARIGKTLVTKE